MKTSPNQTVAHYIAEYHAGVHGALRDMQALIKDAAPAAEERMDYFDMPGYSYPGYDYDGMFAWFSYKKPYVRLHVRPPVLQNFKDDVAEYPTTKSIVSFPEDRKLPGGLIKKLVKASIAVMKQGGAKK